jgi:predicted metal-dependent phosphoesterase TrpH
MLIDMHVHTIYSRDSLIAPEDLIEQAIQLGLDGICVMEHDSMRASEIVEEFALGTEMKVFRGVEATTDIGHILVYGVTPEQWERYEGRLGIPAQEMIDCVREWGGVCIPAHPFRFNSFGVGEKIESLVGVFAVEGHNGKCDAEENRIACEVAERLNLKIIGGSDAHTLGQIGKCATVFERHVSTTDKLIDELKSGQYVVRYMF